MLAVALHPHKSMKIINACNMPLNLPIVRAATKGYDLKICRLHPAQLAAWEMVIFGSAELLAGETGLNPQYIKTLLNEGPKTVAGIPVSVSLDEPKTVIKFLDLNGVIVTQIECLPIPIGFYHD